MIKALERVDWKVFAILLAAGLLGVLAVLPYMAALIGTLPVDRATVPALSLPALVALALLQNGILLSAIIIIGMILSERIGLRMPLIRGWATGAPPSNVKAVALPGILVGAAVGAVLVAMEALLFLPHLPPAMHPLFDIPLWKRLLAGILYGGLTEELVMRLFLLSAVASLLGRWWRSSEGMPTPGAFRAAILLTALLFGLGHLPITSAMTPLTPAIVARALVLNGVAGIGFGYLYWRHSLEAAMLGHMSAHLVMQIPGVMLLTAMLR